MRDFWGTLCSSVKQIKAPYLFDWEHGIALHPMQGIRASSPAEGDVSWDFSSCSRNLGYILELQRGWPFKTKLCSAKSGLLSSLDGHLRNLRTIQTLLRVRRETKHPFLAGKVTLGCLSIFKKNQALSSFEALNSTCLSRCQRM